MKLLDRLVLKDLVPQLLIGIGMFTSLFIALGPLLAASRFLAQGVPLSYILKFVLYNTTSILGQTFPMGMLLAVLLGFGRLSSDSEAVALYAGGIPFLRIALPAAALGLAVSIAGYIVNDPIASYADHQLLQIRQNGLKQQLDTDKPFDLPAKYADSAAGTGQGPLLATVHVEKGFDLQKHILRQVYLTYYKPDGRPALIAYAESAHPLNNDDSNAVAFQLDNVDITWVGKNAYFQHWAKCSPSQLGPSSLDSGPEDTALLLALRNDPNTFPFRELGRVIARLRRDGFGNDPDVRTGDVSRWNKIALPLASLVFAWVGAPLALRPQRSSKLTGWLLSLPIILAYYVLYTVMSSVARSGACSPIFAAFLPDVIGLLVGSALVWKQSIN